MKANYHTHTKLCGHAIGMSEDYIKEAIKNHFLIIGISDHGPIPRNFMTPQEYKNNNLENQMDMQIFKNIYLPDLEKSITKYKNQINILKGIEIEYLSGHDEYYAELLNHLDYMSLGVHYFETPKGIYNTYDLMNHDTIYHYGNQVEKALKTGLFRILNHPDLFMMTYRNNEGKPEFDIHCERVSIQIIEACIRNNVLLEINGGGPRREKVKVGSSMQYVYPRDEFWRIVERYKEAQIIIGCDTHNPVELYDDVIKEVENYSMKFKFETLNNTNLKLIGSK